MNGIYTITIFYVWFEVIFKYFNAIFVTPIWWTCCGGYEFLKIVKNNQLKSSLFNLFISDFIVIVISYHVFIAQNDVSLAYNVNLPLLVMLYITLIINVNKGFLHKIMNLCFYNNIAKYKFGVWGLIFPSRPRIVKSVLIFYTAITL